jgi:hypothetical protein
MWKNDRAQWLLLSAIVVSIGVVALLLLLNTAMLSGHSSLGSSVDFPKNEIRDLKNLAVEQANIIGNETRNTHDLPAFAASYSKFATDIAHFYERQGAIANIESQVDTSLGYPVVWLKIYYYDGDTIYRENTTVQMWVS